MTGVRQLVETYDPDDDEVPPRFLGFSPADWHYISKDDPDGFVFGPVPSREPGDDWTLTFRSEFQKHSDVPIVNLQMPPEVVKQLYAEVKTVPTELPQRADQTECDYCGALVAHERAVPNEQDSPVHRQCYVEYNGAVEWLLSD